MKEAGEQNKKRKMNLKRVMILVVCSIVMALLLPGSEGKPLKTGPILNRHNLKSLPQESREPFQRMLFGNYSLMEGAEKKDFSFVSKLEELWDGSCIFIDMDGDGKDECCLRAGVVKKYYILKYHKGIIKILDEFYEKDYGSVRFLKDGSILLTGGSRRQYYQKRWSPFWNRMICTKIAPMRSVESQYFIPQTEWQPVNSLLEENKEAYFVNYEYDNPVGSLPGKIFMGNYGLIVREEKLYYGNSEDNFYLYVWERGKSPKLEEEIPVQSVYADEPFLYFTERGECHKLYRKELDKRSADVEGLTDFSVESLLKIQGRFYFLSDDAPGIVNPQPDKKYLFSMTLAGTDVQQLMEEPCDSYESDGVILYVSLKDENKIKEINLKGDLLDENSKGMFRCAEREEGYRVGNRVLSQYSGVLSGFLAFDILPEEEKYLYQKAFSGNYGVIEGSEKEDFSFIDSAVDLWRAKCIVLDTNGDGRLECCLKAEEDGTTQYYVLRCQDGKIRICGKFPKLLFVQYVLGKHPYGEMATGESNWQPVLPLLDDDFKTYFMNFAWDNVIGTWGDNVYWSNPKDAASLYYSYPTGTEPKRYLNQPVRNIYMEEEVTYYTNPMDGGKLYRYGPIEGEYGKQATCLTDFPVEKLLKIEGRFYFLSEGYLYSMMLSGVDVKQLSELECKEYFSDGTYLYCTFMEKGKEIQQELDLKGNVIAEGFADLPRMADRGDAYVAGNTILTEAQKQSFLFYEDAPNEEQVAEYDNQPENLSSFISKELTVKGKTQAGVSYSLRVPQYNRKIEGCEKINEALKKQLEEAVKALNSRNIEEEAITIAYEWTYINENWVSISFYDVNSKEKKNPYAFLPPVTFVAQTGEKEELDELFLVSREDYLKIMICAIQMQTDFRWSMEQMAQEFQGDFYLSPTGIMLCYEPEMLEGTKGWEEFLIPYKSMLLYAKWVDKDRYTYAAEDARDYGEFAWERGTDLSYQYRTHHVDTAVMGMGLLNKDEHFERPVISGNGEAASKINAVFDRAEEAFIQEAKEGQLTEYCIDELYWWEEGLPNGYTHNNDAVVPYNKNGIFSTVIGYDWYAGGVVDYGWDTYNFYTDTGERFYLDDVLADDIDTVRQIISDAFLEEMEWEPNLSDYSFKDFDFAMEEEELAIFFDKYEVGCGADGGQIVNIPYAQLHIREEFPLFFR